MCEVPLTEGKGREGKCIISGLTSEKYANADNVGHNPRVYIFFHTHLNNG